MTLRLTPGDRLVRVEVEEDDSYAGRRRLLADRGRRPGPDLVLSVLLEDLADTWGVSATSAG